MDREDDKIPFQTKVVDVTPLMSWQDVPVERCEALHHNGTRCSLPAGHGNIHFYKAHDRPTTRRHGLFSDPKEDA